MVLDGVNCMDLLVKGGLFRSGAIENMVYLWVGWCKYDGVTIIFS